MLVSGLCTWVSDEFISFQRFICSLSFPSSNTGRTFLCVPGGEQGKHSQNVAGEMLSQSHDKKVDAMHK
jgi:hypothetical protein